MSRDALNRKREKKVGALEKNPESRLETLLGAAWFNSPPWRENIPSPVSTAWFQCELTLIGGTEADQTPHYRVVWGQDLEASMVRDRYNARFVPRYVHNVITGMRIIPNPATGLYLAAEEQRIIGTPRFYVEAFLPPSIWGRAGSLAGVDSDGDRYEAYTPESDWFPMIEICDHDAYHTCCATAHEQDRNCHGLYRPPDNRDVETIRGLWQTWQRADSSRPDKPASADAASRAFRYAIERERERLAKLDAEMALHARDFFHARILDKSYFLNGHVTP